MKSKGDDVRMVFFDIEASSLEASFGHTLCFGYKYYGDKKSKVISLSDFKNPKKNEEPDLYLIQRIHTLLTDEADVILSWYGKEYDRKFLNSRMLMVGLPPLPPLNSEHIDLYYTARGNLKLHSNRLQSVSEALGCPVSKTPVRADVWRLAQRGDAKAMKYVVDHCHRDVEILEWVYEKLKPFVRQHPWIGIKGLSCRVCGENNFQRRGFTVTTGAQPKQRLQCKGCGAWSLAN